MADISTENNVAPLLKRIFIFLEDGDWASANEYCERVLDVDPENVSAYLGKLMANCQAKTQEGLKDCGAPFDDNPNYQKVMRFADEDLKSTLDGYIEHIKNRNENTRLESIYQSALTKMNNAKNEKSFTDAIKLFESVSDWKDAGEQISICNDKLKVFKENSKKRAKLYKKIAVIGTLSVAVVIALIIVTMTTIIPGIKYNKAVELIDSKSYKESMELFYEIKGYKDSSEYLSRFTVYYDKCVSNEDGKTFTTEYTYDSDGKLIRERFSSTNKTEYFYDSNGKLIKKVYTSVNNNIPSLNVTTTSEYTYDSNGNMVNMTVVGSIGVYRCIDYTYDRAGNLIKESEYGSLGDSTTTYTYDNNGNLVKAEISSGAIINYTYDNNGNLIKRESTNTPYASTKKYTYDRIGNLIKEVTQESDGTTSTIKYSYYGEHILYTP